MRTRRTVSTSRSAWVLLALAALAGGCGGSDDEGAPDASAGQGGTSGHAGSSGASGGTGVSGSSGHGGVSGISGQAGVSGHAGSAAGAGAGGAVGCQEPLFPGGVLDPTDYRALAANLSSDAAIAFRYGGGCDAAKLPAPAPSPPHLCEPEHRQLEVQPSTFFTYEFGSMDLAKDDYSMTDGQFLSLADSPATDPGISHFTSVIMGRGVFGESPQKTWDYYGGVIDPAAGDKNGSNDAGVVLNGGPVARPVAMARGYNVWSEDALVVLDTGVVAAAGTFTGRTYLYFKFPADKHPVGVAVTNNNEFALFTVWDTTNLKSQVAVVALGSGTDFWGDWKETYPGLMNYGMYRFAKILGYVDLPGISAATEITAVSDFNVCHQLPYACWFANHIQQANMPLSDEASRQTFVGDSFVDGTNIGAFSQAGFAAVIAPAERKLVVLDLRPLFAEVKSMYFTSTENFEKTKSFGDAPDQWPYTFDVAPTSAPTVAKVIDLASRPTAVKADPESGHLYATTVEGTLHVFDVGTLAGRHANAGSTAPSVAEVGKVTVGANVTSLAYMKHATFASTTAGAPRNTLIALSRAQRQLDWVFTGDATPVIDRTLRDDRLVDPIAVEDADNHGTESYVVTVADHGGRKLLNYRYGPITYYTNGGDRFDMCPDGKGAFEFGGAWDLPGKPFAVSVNNTP